MLALDGIFYKKNNIIINELSLTVGKENVCILSQDPMLRSIIFKIISGQERPLEGNVLYNNKNIYHDNQTLRNFFKNIGIFMHNDAFFMDETLLFNINFSYKSKINSRSYDLLRKIGLQDFANYSPKQLSGGMKTRLLLGRLLIHKKNLFILEDPVLGLDPYTGSKIIDLLKTEFVNTSMIVFASSLFPYRSLTKRVIVIGNKGIHYDGSIDNVPIEFR